MPSPFATHEVLNQSPPFEDVNLFTCDRALMEAVTREGAGHAIEQLTEFGSACGSAEAFQRGRLANENTPKLRAFDSKGHRLDAVEFHPAYHECLEVSVREGLHCSAWDHLATPGAKPAAGANVARSAGTYMAIQMEAGHQCPIWRVKTSVLFAALSAGCGLSHAQFSVTVHGRLDVRAVKPRQAADRWDSQLSNNHEILFPPLDVLFL